MISDLLAFRRFVPAAALACLPSLGAQTPTAPIEALAKLAPGDAMAKLVPSGTLVYVQVPSLDRLGAAIRKAATPFSAVQAENMVLDDFLGSMDFPGLLKQVDHGKPVGVCIVFPEGERAEPGRVFLVPALSVEEYVKSVKEKARSVTPGEGGYVAVALDGEAKPAAGPSSIAVGLPAGDLVVRVDVDGLVERFRAEMDAGLGQMESQMEAGGAAMPMGIDPKPLMQMYVDAVRAIVESGETLDLAARLEGTRFKLAEALTMKEKSALAEFGSKEKTDARALASYVDPKAAFSMIMGLDMVAMTKRFQPFLDAVVGMYPEPLRTSLKPLFSGAGEIAAQAGSAMCVSGDIGATGFRAAYYLHPRDASKLVALYKSMLRTVPGMLLDEPKDGEVDGIPVTRLRVHFDIKPLLDAQTKEAADEEQAKIQAQMRAQMQETFDKIYGKDGLSLTIATRVDATAIVIGGDDAYLHEALRRLKAGGGPVPRGLDQVGDLNPCFVTSYNFGRVMHGMAELMGSAMPMPMGIPELSATISAWGGVDGRVWRGATSCDLAEIATAVQAMQSSVTEKYHSAESARAQADIVMIESALDEYAMNNGMKYPDGLDVLVTPDVNGQTYIKGATRIPKDPWGREYQYDPPEIGRLPRVYTLGKDGLPGGEGEDADVDSFMIREKGK